MIIQENLDDRRETLAARRAGLSDATKAALQQRLRGLSSVPAAPAIPRGEKRTGIHPTSFSQQRLWFVDQLVPGNAAYNLGVSVQLTGPVNAAALLRSIAELIRRHDILRTTFRQSGEVIEQLVAPAAPEGEPAASSVDLTHLAAGARRTERERLAHAELTRGFDLTVGPLFRATLVAVDECTCDLHLTMHHIVSDGWSMGVLVRELATLYVAYSRGEPSPLPDLALQYADVARWQRERLRDAVLTEQLAYWTRQLAGAPAVLVLPQARPRPAAPTATGRSVTVVWDRPLREALQALAQREGATLFMTLLAAFAVLLSRYSGQTDVVVGTPVANRPRPELEALIGFFVNTLALRTDLSGEPAFVEVLRRVKDTCLGGFAHQELPFERLVAALQPERDVRYHPVYQVMFVLQNAPVAAIDLDGVQLLPLPMVNDTAKFDLTLSVEESGDGLAATLEYNSELFEPALAEPMLAHLGALLASAVATPEAAVSSLSLLSAEERQELLRWGTQTQPFASDELLHHAFARQAAAYPDAIAVCCGAATLTYRELERRANRLARVLRARGVGPDTLVGLYLERSLELVVGLLGILKAGGAYLPLDPLYPADRLAFMLQDAGVGIVLTASSLAPAVAVTGAETISLDASAQLLAGVSDGPVHVAGEHPDQLAYVIYTSGSTGLPKGALITHRNVARLMTATEAAYAFTPGDVWTLFHSVAFDFSVWEIWGALRYGGRLVVVPFETSRSPHDFYDLLLAEQVTVLNQTPSAFRQLVREDQLRSGTGPLALRYVIFGGEALDLSTLAPWYARHPDSQPQLVNMYGITETTVHVTCRPLTRADVTAGRGSVIGPPLGDLECYVLDAHKQPVPIGVPGELYVGGAGLARGYLNRPELTAQRFMAHPFRAAGRLYKTGDLVRRCPDGEVEYLGRLDLQVKIRGFRIELEEIETVLQQHPAIREAVVLAREDVAEDRRLVAYVVPADGATAGFAELRAHVGARLPEYMVPSAVVALDAFPLTVNGKLDRQALPAPAAIAELPRCRVSPRDPLELRLVDIWQKLLQVRPIGVTDDFFDLGGHSLRVLGLAAAIERCFQRRLPISAIYRARTIASLAALLRQEDAAVTTPAVVLRSAQGGRTLFCVHAASGNAFVYESLAQRLGPHGLVGLHARGLSGDDATSDVRAMATDYAAAIRTIQPEGPYTLVGWSLGGVVAHEIAVQLVAAGATVDLLALLDTFAPIAPIASMDDVDILVELAALYALDCPEAELRSLDRHARVDRVVAAAQQAQLLPEGTGRIDIERVVRTYQANLEALERHQPGVFTGRALLLQASQTAIEDEEAVADAMGWTGICPSLEVRVVAGSHRSMVLEPDVASLGALLVEELARLSQAAR